MMMCQLAVETAGTPPFSARVYVLVTGHGLYVVVAAAATAAAATAVRTKKTFPS